MGRAIRFFTSATRAVGLLAGVLVMGCGSITFPERTPTIQGEIVGIGDDTPFGGATTIWVKEDPDEQCGIVFQTTEAFIGERVDDGLIRQRDFDRLARGQQVRVWAGAIAESCPGQGSAGAIEILSR